MRIVLSGFLLNLTFILVLVPGPAYKKEKSRGQVVSIDLVFRFNY